jgi:hypothetical protein
LTAPSGCDFRELPMTADDLNGDTPAIVMEHDLTFTGNGL